MVPFKTKNQIFLILLCITMSMALNGQNLNKHQWKNRVILIIANDLESETYASQTQEFKANNQEFEERKLIIYKVLPNKYKIDIPEDNSWVRDSKFYTKYNSNARDFKIILIGLDGAVKLEQHQVLTTKELFSTIDSMPMRSSELRNKQ